MTATRARSRAGIGRSHVGGGAWLAGGSVWPTTDDGRDLSLALELYPAEDREEKSAVVIERIRKLFGPIYDAKFSPDGKVLRSIGHAGRLLHWNLSTAEANATFASVAAPTWRGNFASGVPSASGALGVISAE